VSHQEHRAKGPVSVGCFVLTVSDTRTGDTDTSGRAIREFLERAGHQVTGFAIVRDEPALVTASVTQWLTDIDTRVIITTGGTGIAKRDVTIEAISPLLEKRLPGFGELFRAASVADVGGAAMATRAEAGVAAGKLVFVLPGSPDACRLAMEKLILPEAGHLVGLLRREARG